MGLPAASSVATPQRWMPRAEVHQGAQEARRTDRRSGTRGSHSADTHQMEGSVEFCSTYVRSRNRKMLRIMIWGQRAKSVHARPLSGHAAVSDLTRLPHQDPLRIDIPESNCSPWCWLFLFHPENLTRDFRALGLRDTCELSPFLTDVLKALSLGSSIPSWHVGMRPSTGSAGSGGVGAQDSPLRELPRLCPGALLTQVNRTFLTDIRPFLPLTQCLAWKRLSCCHHLPPLGNKSVQPTRESY